MIETALKSRLITFRTRCCAVLLAVWSVVVAVPLVTGDRSAALVTTLIVGTGALVMTCCGLRAHRPRRPLPWYLLSSSVTLYAAGAVLREVSADRAAELCSLAAFASMTAAVATWLRPRRARGDSDLALDSALIGLAALLASWTFLISPAVGSAATVTAVLVVGHPLLDAVLLGLLAHSVATVGRSEISLRLLHLGLALVLLGDVLQDLDRTGLAGTAPAVQQTPMLLAYAAIGIAALHPTMSALGGPRHIHPHRSRQRASVIAGALIVAALVPVLGSSLGLLDRVVVSTLFALLLIGVLLRSERAIQRSLRSERRAQYQADHDMLTGLLNRSALLRALSREHTPWRPGPLGLLFIDLDGFKRINDNFGHAVGDELIADTAARIRRVAGRDPVVARYGGDEFVVLTPTSAAESAALAERLLDAFGEPFALSVGEVRVTASIGIACTPGGGHGVLVDDLVREADAAMYHAKDRALGYAFHPDSVVDEPTARPGEADSGLPLAQVPGLGDDAGPAPASRGRAEAATGDDGRVVASAAAPQASPVAAVATGTPIVAEPAPAVAPFPPTHATRRAVNRSAATGHAARSSTGTPFTDEALRAFGGESSSADEMTVSADAIQGEAGTTLTAWLRRTGRKQTAGRAG